MGKKDTDIITKHESLSKAIDHFQRFGDAKSAAVILETLNASIRNAADYYYGNYLVSFNFTYDGFSKDDVIRSVQEYMLYTTDHPYVLNPTLSAKEFLNKYDYYMGKAVSTTTRRIVSE